MKKPVMLIILLLAFLGWNANLGPLESSSAKDQIGNEMIDMKYATAFLSSSEFCP